MSTPRLASPKPKPYQSVDMPSVHVGVISVTGTKLIDLGIGHNNYVVSGLEIEGTATEAALAYSKVITKGTKKGTFTITLYKRDASYGPWILATAAVTIHFTVIEGTPVSLNG